MLLPASAPRCIGGVLDDAIRLWQAALMTTWRLSLMSAALYVAGLVGIAAAGAEPRDDVHECAVKFAAAGAHAKLEELCPQLDESLNALVLTGLLDTEARKKLSPAALDDLVALSARYSVTRPSAAPATGSLAQIAEQVNGKKPAVVVTWWERFKSWARSWFSRHTGSGNSWFDEWLQQLSNSSALLTAILYICMAMTVAAALIIVFVELRAAGLLGRAARAKADSRLAPSFESKPQAARDGVAQLLGLLVARLIQTRRLPFERALTHRELIARSVFDTPEQRRAFALVARAAESLLYGGAAAAGAPQPVMEQGTSLLAQLTDLAPREPH
jgi:hypothetical protein